jgi:hypothetical protein
LAGFALIKVLFDDALDDFALSLVADAVKSYIPVVSSHRCTSLIFYVTSCKIARLADSTATFLRVTL